MAETEAVDAPAPATPAKKAKASKPRKPKAPASHPKVSEMVNEAIENLKEKGGSSLQAIKKYISGNFKVDIERLSPFIRKYLKSAVVGGSLVQTKGKGASGSFRMGGSAPKSDKPKAKKPAVKAVKKAKSPVKKVTKAAPKKAVKKPKAKAAAPKKPKAAGRPKGKKAKAPAKKAAKAKK